MALLLARRQRRCQSNPYLIRLFSKSSAEPPPQAVEKPSQSPPDSSYSSPFTDIKTTLRQKLEQQQEQERKSFVRSSDAQAQNRGSTRSSVNQSRGSSLQDLGINLANFQRRSTAPPSRYPGGVPLSQSRPQISLEALFKQNATPNSADPRNRQGQDINSINVRESLKNLKAQSNRETTEVPLRSFKNTLKTVYKGNVGMNVFGRGEALPASVFGTEMDERKGREGETEEMKTEFLKIYREDELGEKLRMLRPEGKTEEGWFSLEELNQRLAKLRQVEEKEVGNQRGGKYAVLRNVIGTFQDETANNEAITQQNFDILSCVHGTPEYKHYPPKDDLVETYFHTDNLSSAEKMKIELTKVREDFKMSESDCGSARVQVAQLTTKIKHLASALHKKDKHSRKGLLAMVQKRKKLLKYLRRTDWDSYCLVLSRLSLRDNPDYKL